MSTYEPTHGSLAHIELYSDDLDATRTFYEAAFGWTVEPVEGMEAYLMWQAPDPPAGGLTGPGTVPFEAPGTLCYVTVDDLDAARSSIEAAGGELLTDETAIPELGAFIVFRDPGGIVEAVWESRDEGEPPAEGWQLFTDEPDPGSVVHFELYSADPEATQAFHERVFGWTFESVGDGEYVMARPPTPPYGGVMPAGEELPVGSLTYLLVDSAEETARTIEDAGGTLVREPFDVEGWGTMAVFEAPGGVVGAVWEAAPEQAEAPAAGAPEREPVGP